MNESAMQHLWDFGGSGMQQGFWKVIELPRKRALACNSHCDSVVAVSAAETGQGQGQKPG